MKNIIFALLLLLCPQGLLARESARLRPVSADPAPDKAHPARMEAVHIPTGGVEVNGVAYLASGAGPHPVMILFHGWPGNEKNGDIAQAVRRAGWHVVLPNYRGSWGSPGSFRFAHVLEDGKAVVAFVRDPANAAKYGFDPARIVLVGHSMGGWNAIMTAQADPAIAGAVTISGGNMGQVGRLPRDRLVKESASNAESLAGTSPELMADELAANAQRLDWQNGAAALADRPVLALSSDDGLAAMTDALVAAARAAGGKRIDAVHVATDHAWSDSRIRLQGEIVRWLDRNWGRVK